MNENCFYDILILGYAFSDYFSTRIHNSDGKNNSNKNIINLNDKDKHSNNISSNLSQKNSSLENLISYILDYYVIEASDHKSKIYSNNSSCNNIEYYNDNNSADSNKSCNSHKSYKSYKSIGSTDFKTKSNEYLRELEKKINDYECLIDNLKNKIKEVENENVYFQSKIKDLENELDENYKILSKKDSYQTDLIKENESLSDLKLIIARKNEEIKLLQISSEHKSSNNDREIVMLKEKINSQNENISNLILENKEIQKLKNKLKEYSQMDEKIKQLNSTSNLEKDNKALKNKIIHLESELDELKSKCRVLNEINNEMTKKSLDEEIKNKKNLKVIIDSDINNISDILTYKDMKTISKDNSPNSVLLNNIMTPYVNNCDSNKNKFNFNGEESEFNKDNKLNNFDRSNTNKENLIEKDMNSYCNQSTNPDELNFLSLLIHSITEENLLLNLKFKEMSDNFDNLCNSYNKLSLMYMNSNADKGLFSGIFKKSGKESKEMAWLEKEKNKYKEYLDDLY